MKIRQTRVSTLRKGIKDTIDDNLRDVFIIFDTIDHYQTDEVIDFYNLLIEFIILIQLYQIIYRKIVVIDDNENFLLRVVEVKHIDQETYALLKFT